SIHSTLETPSVWRILPHPNNEHTIQIIEANDHCIKLKLKDEGQGDCLQSATKLDELKCADSLKTPIHLAYDKILFLSVNYRLFGWIIYVVLLCLRFIFVFDLQSGYLHPDEYFQSIEIAAGDVYNLKVMRTWEFKVNNMGPVRSVAGMSPFVHIPVVIYKWIADRISSRSANTHYSGSDLINRVLLPSRLATALGSLFIDMFILSSCMHIHHSRTLKLTRVQHFLSFIRYNSVPTASLLYASCAFGGILLSTRTIVNTWESIYVSVFGLLFFEILNHIKRSDVLQGKQYFITILICIQSSLIVWASFLRPTYLLFILPIGIIELVFLVAKFKIIFIATRLPIISALIIFYGYLHQAGILSYMRTISIDVNDCVTHVFFRTYMPPRFPLGIPLTKSSNDVIQSCISLIDLSGSSVSVLNTTLNNLKANQNSTGIIKLYSGYAIYRFIVFSDGNTILIKNTTPTGLQSLFGGIMLSQSHEWMIGNLKSVFIYALGIYFGCHTV
ncbi:unnamed protein product, partial [Trichobilharzia regenti]